MNKIPTTNEIDHITAEERDALKAFCENEQTWWNFSAKEGPASCPVCGGRPSEQIGFQVMTQRTYQAELHGKKKLKKR